MKTSRVLGFLNSLTMVNPGFHSPIQPLFFQPLLPGFHNDLNIPVKFFMKHIEGKNESKTVRLRSDVSYKTWEVKLDGRRFTDGWEEFADDHDLRIGDIVVFRHEGDMVFLVTGFGPSCCNIQYSSSPCYVDDNSDERNIGKLPRRKKVKKNSRTEAVSSSDQTCFVASVTAANLRSDSLHLPGGFVRSNGLNRRCEIILMNEQGKSWTLVLRRKNCYQVCIRRGWRRFCNENGLEVGCFFTFKLVWMGTTPVLRTGSSNNRGPKECLEANEEKEEAGSGEKKTCRWRKRVPSSRAQDRFVTLTLTTYNLRRGQLRLPIKFTRHNGINKAGHSMLFGKDGVEWPTDIKQNKGRGFFYLVKGWRLFFQAHNVKKDEPFVLELIWDDTNPTFKLCY